MTRVKLITHEKKNKHVAHEVAGELESAILADKRITPAPSNAFYRTLNKIYPYLYRFGLPIPRLPFDILKGDYLVVLMGTWDFRDCMPYFMTQGRKFAYIFDAWQEVHPNIIDFVRKWRVEHVFVSSSQASSMLNSYGSGCRFHWIPEGIDYSRYQFYSYYEKDIDVIQMGRKFDEYHDSIIGPLDKDRISYLYEKVKGQVIFPETADFIDGLARSKISICFPSNITHDERAGDIETLTNRYLQSMASKCLIVGHAPFELIELFGYNPVIEADLTNPAQQLKSILDNFRKYIPLIEKNLSHLNEHTWPKRWMQMAQAIFSKNYEDQKDREIQKGISGQ